MLSLMTWCKGEQRRSLLQLAECLSRNMVETDYTDMRFHELIEPGGHLQSQASKQQTPEGSSSSGLRTQRTKP